MTGRSSANQEEWRQSLKQVFKEALTEILREQRELLHEVIADFLEDIALAEAIREGRQTEPVSREKVTRLLR